MLDWGLRLALLLALPCAAALLVFPEALVATLFQRGKFDALAAAKTAYALRGYGVGLVGLIGVKILAPGFYARQDIRTPVTIAVIVLALTQAMNAVFVPLLRPRRPGALGQPRRDDQRRLALRRPEARRLVPAGAGLGAVRAQGRVRDAGDERAPRGRPPSTSTGSAWPAASRARRLARGLPGAAPRSLYFGVLLAAGMRPREFSRRA